MQRTRGLIEWTNSQVKGNPYFFTTEKCYILCSLPCFSYQKSLCTSSFSYFAPCLVSSICASEAQADMSASKPSWWPLVTRSWQEEYEVLLHVSSMKVTPMVLFHVWILLSVHRTQYKFSIHSKCTLKAFQYRDWHFQRRPYRGKTPQLIHFSC